MKATLEKAKAILEIRERIEAAEPRDRIELAKGFRTRLAEDGEEIARAFVELSTAKPAVKGRRGHDN